MTRVSVNRPRQGITEDGRAICQLLRGAIIRAGWSETARRAGIDRSALHRAFPAAPRGRAPSFTTVLAVANALSLEFTVRRRAR